VWPVALLLPEKCEADPDLPDFFGPVISGMMALQPKGRADEKEPLHR
jgi:hypothetical protein